MGYGPQSSDIDSAFRFILYTLHRHFCKGLKLAYWRVDQLGNEPNATHLIEHDAALAKANQHQLGFVQIEVLPPPQRIAIAACRWCGGARCRGCCCRGSGSLPRTTIVVVVLHIVGGIYRRCGRSHLDGCRRLLLLLELLVVHLLLVVVYTIIVTATTDVAIIPGYIVHCLWHFVANYRKYYCPIRVHCDILLHLQYINVHLLAAVVGRCRLWVGLRGDRGVG